jgi:hypothetical protein
MKKLVVAIAIVMSMFSINILAQNESVTYKVTNYSINGINYDNLALEGDIALSFYMCENNSPCFANVWRNKNSQSYGGVYSFKTNDIAETETTYAAKEFTFTWRYFNSYDSDNGEAKVSITQFYIGSTVKFEAEIVLMGKNEILLLKGYLE